MGAQFLKFMRGVACDRRNAPIWLRALARISSRFDFTLTVNLFTAFAPSEETARLHRGPYLQANIPNLRESRHNKRHARGL